MSGVSASRDASGLSPAGSHRAQARNYTGRSATPEWFTQRRENYDIGRKLKSYRTGGSRSCRGGKIDTSTSVEIVLSIHPMRSKRSG
jgi:hypothetical protein